jgi:hypothetical protein
MWREILAVFSDSHRKHTKAQCLHATLGGTHCYLCALLARKWQDGIPLHAKRASRTPNDDAGETDAQSRIFGIVPVAERWCCCTESRWKGAPAGEVAGSVCSRSVSRGYTATLRLSGVAWQCAWVGTAHKTASSACLHLKLGNYAPRDGGDFAANENGGTKQQAKKGNSAPEDEELSVDTRGNQSRWQQWVTLRSCRQCIPSTWPQLWYRNTTPYCSCLSRKFDIPSEI